MRAYNQKTYYVYIMTNKSFTLYVGVTNDIVRRTYEHKKHLVEGFTAQYNIDKLIYLEEYKYIYEAITREKQLKGWTRKKKIDLIKSLNPNFDELSF